LIVAIGVLVKGNFTIISGASTSVGEGVTVGVTESVGVSVIGLGVSVGGRDVLVRLGNGVLDLVGVCDWVGFGDFVDVGLSCGVDVLLGVVVELGVVVGVSVSSTLSETAIGP
jgi:hypothetical protein